MKRTFLILYLLVGVGFIAEAFSFYHSFYRNFENIVEASVIRNLEFTEVVSGAPIKPKTEKEVRLIFVGDIMLSRSVGERIAKENDFSHPFQKISSTIQAADLAFANLENPVSDRGANQGSIYSFRADPRTIEGLASAGFDIVSLANNHIWDYGRDALSDTVSLLEKSGVKSIGAGRTEAEANASVIIEKKGVKIGFLGFTDLLPKSLEAKGANPGLSHSDLAYIKEAVGKLRPQVDLLVVSAHWGEEYAAHPREEQKVFAHQLVESGVDLVIGHHPHVVQDVEHYIVGNGLPSEALAKDGWIAYSLGNFVFDQSFSTSTMTGLLFEVSIKNKKIDRVFERKINISRDFQPSL